MADLPERIARFSPSEKDVPTLGPGKPLTLEQLEVEHIRRILADAPSLDAAAHTLGIDPSTLYRKRKQYGL